MTSPHGFSRALQDRENVGMASLFRVVAQVHAGARRAEEVTLETRSREEDDSFDEGGTDVAQGALMQEQRFQLFGFAIGQQQRIVFGEVPPLQRPRPGARVTRNAARA